MKQGDDKSNPGGQGKGSNMQNQSPSTSQLPSFLHPNFPMGFLSQQSPSSFFNMQQQLARQAENATRCTPDSTTREISLQENAQQNLLQMTNNWYTQDWMQNYSKLYSPLPSNAPSMMSYASGKSFPDDASVTSRMSSISNSNGFTFLPNTLSLDANKPNAENLDPITNANQSIDQLIGLLSDNDADIRQRCIDILLKITKQLFQNASSGKIKSLVLSLIVLITDTKRITFGSTQHRHLLTVIHQMLCMDNLVGHASREAARNERYFLHLMNILSTVKKSERILYPALNSLRNLMFRSPEWKKFIMNRGGMELLLGFLDVSRFEFKVRHTAVRCLADLTKYEKLHAKQFINLHGIEILTRCIFDDFSQDIVFAAMNCLIHVSDLQEISTVCLDRTLELAIKVIVSSSQSQDGERQLQNVRNAISFISNALVINPSAKKHITLMKEPRALEFIVSTAWQCIQFANGQLMEKSKKKFAYDILDRCLVAISVINREDNCECAQASIMLANNKLCGLLFEAVMHSSNVIYQSRIITCWFQMLPCEVIPPHLFISSAMMKFIIERVEEAYVKRNKEQSEQSKPEPTHFRDVVKAIISLKHLTEVSLQQSEIIIGIINAGQFNPFDLISKLTNEEKDFLFNGILAQYQEVPLYRESFVCINLLAFLEFLSSKEFTLRTKWAQDKNATQMLHYCAQSPNNRLSEISAKLLKQIEFGTEDYVSPLYDAFNGPMDFN